MKHPFTSIPPTEDPSFSPQEEQKLLQFGARLTAFAETLRPSLAFHLRVKERLMARIARGFSLREVFHTLFTGPRGMAFASLGVLFFLLVSTLTPWGLIAPVGATYIGDLESQKGIVYVKRDGKVLRGYTGQRLYIGDEIVVEADGEAVISFIDDSQGILSEKTDLSIAKALINPENKDDSHIEVDLRSGTIEATVDKGDEVGGARFTVTTPTSQVATQNAAFSVVVDKEGQTEVVAYRDEVHVSSKLSEEEANSGKVLVKKKEIGGKVKIQYTEEENAEGVEVVQLPVRANTSSGKVIFEIYDDQSVQESHKSFIVLDREDSLLVKNTESFVSIDEKRITAPAPGYTPPTLEFGAGVQRKPALSVVNVPKQVTPPVVKAPEKEVEVEDPKVQDPHYFTRDELDLLTSRLRFAELKLNQGREAFRKGKDVDAYKALYNYQDRLLGIHAEFFGPHGSSFAAQKQTLATVLNEQVGSKLLAHIRQLTYAPEDLSKVQTILSLMRTLIAAEINLRSELQKL